MKIYPKIVIGYLISGVIGFLLIFLAVFPLIEYQAEQAMGNRLYDCATRISKDFTYRNFAELADYQTIQSELSDDATLDNSTIWIVTRNGSMVYDTSNTYAANTQLSQFDTTYFDGNVYKTGNFNGLVANKTVSAIVPVNLSYATIGYIIVHASHAQVVASCQDFEQSALIAALTLYSSCFVLIVLFTICIYVPLSRITTACKSYAAGDFSYDEIHVTSNDELGQLAGILEYMAHSLSDSNEYQQKFIANISHDFRSPLTSIKGYVEAMLDGTIPPELQEKYLHIVLKEAERLTKLTENLLTMNTWGANGKQLILSDFDITKVIRDTLASFEGICLDKRIQIDLILEQKVHMVWADMSKIQQVVYNLIDNAIKFSPSNSIIQISVKEKGEKIFVTVKDHGIGIPSDELRKIWERFYKTDVSRGKDKTGSGLGLSIVKEIIHSHNENIDVVSTEGAGTEFTFSLMKSHNS
jgi:signal transduction histidine kinase